MFSSTMLRTNSLTARTAAPPPARSSEPVKRAYLVRVGVRARVRVRVKVRVRCVEVSVRVLVKVRVGCVEVSVRVRVGRTAHHP